MERYLNYIQKWIEKTTPNSTVAFIYDTYSATWEIPLVLAEEAVNRGWAVVISNYTKPIFHLLRDLKVVGLDTEKALQKNLLFIIDVFGSKYRVKEERKNVFYLDNVEPETINPKIYRIYEEYILPNLPTDRMLRIIHPLHGVVQLAGETPTIRLLAQTIAMYSNLPVESILLLSLNRDTVSKQFTAWTIELSDYVFLSQSHIERGDLKEYLYFLKAPLPEFVPRRFRIKQTGKKGVERFKVENLEETTP